MTLSTLTLPFSHLRTLIARALDFNEFESECIDMTNVVPLMEALGHIRVDTEAKRFSWRRHALNEYELIEIFSDAYQSQRQENA